MSDDLDRLAAELTALRVPKAAGASRLEPWLQVMAERGRAICCWSPASRRLAHRRAHGAQRRRACSTATTSRRWSCPNCRRTRSARSAKRHRRRVAEACRASAGSASTCIANAAARRRRSACCRARVPTLASLDLPPGTELLSRLPRGSCSSAARPARARPRRSRRSWTRSTGARPGTSSRSRIRSSTSTPTSGASIQQIEIGIDAPDFPTALRAALRQAPDVHRHRRDARSGDDEHRAGGRRDRTPGVVHAAHDRRAVDDRAHDRFVPRRAQPTIRQEIAAALAAVFVQTLVPRDGGRPRAGGRTARVGYGARQHIRRNALQHLHQEITITRKHGSFSLEECLARLVRSGVIDRAEALLRANHVEDFEHALTVPSPPPSS